MTTAQGHGLIIPKIETHEEGVNHVLGAAGLPEPVINPSGNWLAYLPTGERQSRGRVETNACTIFGTEDAFESLVSLKTGTAPDYADRYAAAFAKRKGVLNPASGANPHNVAEMFRNDSGNLAEELAPWTADVATVADYYALDLAPLIPQAALWYKQWRLRHKWVFIGGTPAEKRAALKDALTKGTVCVSVHAWNRDDDHPWYSKPPRSTDNHWVQLVSADGDDPYKIFDSYEAYVKDLDPLYDFSLAKVYFLVPPPHVFTKNLGFQMTDPEVAELQKALIALGYPIPHAVTTLYGTETKRAVWDFQIDHRIDDDGTHFGPKTRYAMNVGQNPDQLFGGSIATFIQSLFSSV